MKVVILAGGFGTRIAEESQYKPKPMIEIGGRPILWHIMKQYAYYGFNEFIICAGYKQSYIKSYFADYLFLENDVTFDFEKNGEMTIHHKLKEKWKVTVVDTGLNTMTGGRVKRIKQYLNNERFFLTYGDGVSNIDLKKELDFHVDHGKMVTLAAYNVKQRFGVIDCDAKGNIIEFREKALGDGNLVNIGFMICEPEFLELIEDDQTVLEKTPMELAVKRNQLMAYKHTGFWQCMDTVREMNELEKMWQMGKAPWKLWED